MSPCKAQQVAGQASEGHSLVPSGYSQGPWYEKSSLLVSLPVASQASLASEAWASKEKGTSLGRIACPPQGAIAQEVEPKAKNLRVLLRQLGAKGLWPISPQAWLQVCGVSEHDEVQGFEFYSAEEIRGSSAPSGFL